MQKNLFLILGIALLATSILFIGLVRYNQQNSTELFIKYKPSLIFNFSSEDGQVYEEFVSDHHVDDRGRSLLPLLLMQLTLTSFILSPIRTDLKRKLFLFALHFVLGFCGSFQLLVMAADQTNKFIAAGILAVVITIEYFLMKLFAPKNADKTENVSLK